MQGRRVGFLKVVALGLSLVLDTAYAEEKPVPLTTDQAAAVAVDVAIANAKQLPPPPDKKIPVPIVEPDKPHYPKAYQQPIEIGSEDFLQNYKALEGLTGVHVDVKTIINSSNNLNYLLPADFAEKIRDKIESAGLKFLTEEEMETTAGQPLLNLWPSYKGGGQQSDSISANSSKDANQCHIEESCENSIWAGFSQSASILRQPDNQYRLSTWGAGDNSKICLHRGDWMAEAAYEKVDEFIMDYQKAESEKKPLLVQGVDDLPSSCSQSWTTFRDVFDTDETTINEKTKPIFNKFGSNAANCAGFSYVIETHADQRADADYNKILTIARAHAVKEYFMSRGVTFARLKLRPMGESSPLSDGNSDKDHAANRRVTVIPVNIELFSAADLDL